MSLGVEPRPLNRGTGGDAEIACVCVVPPKATWFARAILWSRIKMRYPLLPVHIVTDTNPGGFELDEPKLERLAKAAFEAWVYPWIDPGMCDPETGKIITAPTWETADETEKALCRKIVRAILLDIRIADPVVLSKVLPLADEGLVIESDTAVAAQAVKLLGPSSGPPFELGMKAAVQLARDIRCYVDSILNEGK